MKDEVLKTVKKYAILMAILLLVTNAIGFLLAYIEVLSVYNKEYSLLSYLRWLDSIVLFVVLLTDYHLLKVGKMWFLLVICVLPNPYIFTLLILILFITKKNRVNSNYID